MFLAYFIELMDFSKLKPAKKHKTITECSICAIQSSFSVFSNVLLFSLRTSRQKFQKGRAKRAINF
jgi:hypothetical protein